MGKDLIRPGTGDDRIDGGSGGQDRVSYVGHTRGVRVSLATRAAQATGAGKDSFIGVEAITGTAYSDVLIGDLEWNYFYGGGGADKLYGRDGTDRLYGEGGNDYLYGGDYADHLWGGSGSDHLYGGTGSDALYGGSGTDYVSQ